LTGGISSVFLRGMEGSDSQASLTACFSLFTSWRQIDPPCRLTFLFSSQKPPACGCVPFHSNGFQSESTQDHHSRPSAQPGMTLGFHGHSLELVPCWHDLNLDRCKKTPEAKTLASGVSLGCFEISRCDSRGDHSGSRFVSLAIARRH
jgi:hypothetical protein